MTVEEIHSLLIAEGEARSLPECYKNDLLVHDLNWLHEYGSQEFVWILRTCGTFMFPLDCMDAEKGHYHKRYNWPDELLSREYSSDKDVHYYHFLDGVLTHITYEQAAQLGKDAVSKHNRNEARKRQIAALSLEVER